MYKFLSEAERVAMGGKLVYCCHLHGGNVSYFTSNRNLWTGEKLREYILAFEERAEYIAKRFPRLADYARYSTYSYEISMCRQMLDAPPEGTKEILEEMRRDLRTNRRQILEYSF